MPIFEREERYVVFKIKDLTDEQMALVDQLRETRGLPTVQCVVIEHDWPIYERAWALVEDQWVSDITTD